MARLNAREFEQRVRNWCANSPMVARVSILSEGMEHTQLRIFLLDLSFVDVYYNHSNGKTSFAQILNETRIFGADNTRGNWHWHPREEPFLHVESKHAISFEEFFREVEKNAK